MGVNLNFNAASVPPAEPGFPIWEGMVPVMIKKTETQNTAANDGNKYLAIHVMALDGHYRGQENVIRLNLWNSNSKAVEIAWRQLSSICHVTGRMTVQDSDQLIGAQFLSVWAKEDREVMDQATGQKKALESCQIKDFRYLDGRTIKEAAAGQPASSPYQGGGAPAAPSAPPTAPNVAPPPMAPPGGFQPSGAPASGMPPAQPPGPPGGFQSNVPPPGFPGAVSPVQPGAGPAPGGMSAPGQFGAQPGQQPASTTAGYGFNPGAPVAPGQAPGGFQSPAPGQPPAWGR